MPFKKKYRQLNIQTETYTSTLNRFEVMFIVLFTSFYFMYVLYNNTHFEYVI